MVVIHNDLPDFFLFVFSLRKGELLKAGIRAHREIAKSSYLSDGGIQCVTQRRQKECISIKIDAHAATRG